MNPTQTEESLRMQNARLAALHQVAMGLTSTLDLSGVLQRVVEMAQSLANSAHAHIFLYDAGRDEITHAASHWSADERHIVLNPRREGITYRVARSGAAEFIAETSNHPAYAETRPDLRPGALACLPLVKGKHILGTLNLGFWAQHQFDPDERSFLDLMARQAAIAIDTARLYSTAIEKAQLERELQVARGLQASLIPRETPRLPGWEFAARWQPAHIVGGDFYDFVCVGSGAAQGIVIADVSDKGMPAALFMALARSTLRASVTDGCCPADFIAHANRLLAQETVRGMFVTAFYAQIDPATNGVTHVNAGHNPPLFYQRARNELREWSRTGIALGVDGSRLYHQRELTMDRGDFFVGYTDGVTDAANAAMEMFGEDRLREKVWAQRHSSAEEIITALLSAVRDFAGSVAPFDDLTAVVVKRV